MNKYYQRFHAFLENVITLLASGGEWLKKNCPLAYDIVAFVLSMIGLTAIFAEYVFVNPVMQILGIALFLSIGITPLAIILAVSYIAIQVAQLLDIELPTKKA